MSTAENRQSPPSGLEASAGASGTTPGARLAEQVAALGWYQTIELPGGVHTPGVFDTVAAAPRTLLPPALDGKRCLDVGTSNGFWAYEMERRGASEVVAVDLPGLADADWPAFDPMATRDYPDGRAGFDLAHGALGSGVEHRKLSVYDVTPDELGRFDLVFVGTLLLHLRDPIRALTAVRSVTAEALVLNESISLPLTLAHPRSPTARLVGTGGSNWWIPNKVGLERMVQAAGFEVTATSRPYVLRWGAGRPAWGRAATGARIRGLLRNLGRAAAGIPHLSMHAEPRNG